MALVNFRDVRERFQHLDASFVSFEHSFKTRTASFSVAFYPSWEHPRRFEALAAGKRLKFNKSVSEGNRVVTVHAKGLYALSSTFLADVEAWDFYEEHPWLWRYEESSNITCNSPLRFEVLLDVVEDACNRLGYSGFVRETLDYINVDNVRRYGDRPPFSLGRLPRPLFLAMKDELERRQLESSANYEPKVIPLPILFVVDNYNYIIAEDFEVDVPDFEHKNEWLQS